MEFRVEKANIVNVTADAIVLPSNETLACASKKKGAFSAIFEAAGKEKLTRACEEILRETEGGRCAIGSAVVTRPFGLTANTDCIIHAVVPKWEGGEYEEYSKLCSAYLSALALADHLECESIAFPLLASGVKKFSKDLAIKAAAECFRKFQGENLKEIILVVYDDNSVRCAKQLGYKVHETYRNPHKKASNPRVGKQIAGRAKAAMKWLADPENQKMIRDCVKLVMWALTIGGLVKNDDNSPDDTPV